MVGKYGITANATHTFRRLQYKLVWVTHPTNRSKSKVSALRTPCTIYGFLFRYYACNAIFWLAGSISASSVSSWVLAVETLPLLPSNYDKQVSCVKSFGRPFPGNFATCNACKCLLAAFPIVAFFYYRRRYLITLLLLLLICYFTSVISCVA